MFGFGNRSRSSPRRWAAREGRQGYAARSAGAEIPRHDIVPSLAIAGIFCVAITAMFLLRKQVVPYRPGEYVPHDIVARVDFRFFDQARNDQLIQYKRDSVFRDYRRVEGDPWDKIQDFLLALPETIHGRSQQELDPPLRDLLDSGAITELEQERVGLDREQYESNVRQFIAYSRKHLLDDDEPLVIVPQDARDEETRLAARYPGEPRQIKLLPPFPIRKTRRPPRASPRGSSTSATSSAPISPIPSARASTKPLASSAWSWVRKSPASLSPNSPPRPTISTTISPPTKNRTRLKALSPPSMPLNPMCATPSW